MWLSSDHIEPVGQGPVCSNESGSARGLGTTGPSPHILPARRAKKKEGVLTISQTKTKNTESVLTGAASSLQVLQERTNQSPSWSRAADLDRVL